LSLITAEALRDVGFTAAELLGTGFQDEKRQAAAAATDFLGVISNVGDAIERGYVARELVPFGSAESADLLTAFDRRLQEGSLETASVVPIARLMSVGDLVHRADLTYERFRTPRPVPLAAFLDSIPSLGAPIGFGEPNPNVAGPEQTLLDEIELSIDPSLPHPAPVTSYAVPDPLDVVRLRSSDAVLIVVGDGEGLVDAAAAGVLDLDRTVVFGADLAISDDLREQLTQSPTEIVITDSNRRRARLWGTLRENVGITEIAGTEPLLFNTGDNRLPIFQSAATAPDVDDTRTVAVHLGGPTVTASRFGNPVTYALDDRPVQAIDGDLSTAWNVAAFAEARGEFLRYDFGTPTTIETIHAVQPLVEANRHITQVEIHTGDKHRVVDLTSLSWSPNGETVTFEPLTGSVFDIIITDLYGSLNRVIKSCTDQMVMFNYGDFNERTQCISWNLRRDGLKKFLVGTKPVSREIFNIIRQ
ncbi:MAG: alpha-(1-_3)-arabinofuranosyltransferase family protein, partial [Acidimicrobiales bacterium]|nr:alpha-(1->3)-arabinofuranosyltransferase family protein [Acidimicrobiales bacterium]